MNPAPSSHTQDLQQAVNNAQRLIASGKIDLAEQQARVILDIHPNEINALRILGCSKREQGDFQLAKEILTSVVERAPDFALAQLDLGITLQALQQYDLALKALEIAVAKGPTLERAWGSLGEGYLQLGREESAQQAFQKQLKHSRRDPELIKAVELVGENRLGQAEPLCRQYLKRNPTDVSAIRLLAEIGIKLKMYADAEKLLQRCLELAPDFDLARLNYASAISGLQRPAEALKQVEILEAKGVKPANLSLKASLFAQIGDYPRAVDCYEYLIANYPPQAKLFLSYGHALKTLGRQDDSVKAYRQSIKLQPSLGEAYWSLANLKMVKFDESDLQAMKDEIDSGKALRTDFYHLCFALGKAYEDAKEFEASFKYYQYGNEVKRRLEGYSSKVNHEETVRLQDTCSKEMFALHEESGCQRQDPIFILGLPRSGSTLLEQILASHSMVDGTKELPDIIAIARRLGGRRKKSDRSLYPEVLQELSPAQLTELGEEYLERASVQRGDAPFFIDKMPNNFAHIGLIKLILPKARIIDARRHPMATCFSGFKQLFASGQRFTYGLEDIGHYYKDYIALMAHWDKILPGQVHRVFYEHMVEDTEAEVRRLLDCCGLPFEESCMNFYQAKRAVRTASSEQVRQPIYRAGLEQWKNFEAYLQPLSDILKDEIKQYPFSS